MVELFSHLLPELLAAVGILLAFSFSLAGNVSAARVRQILIAWGILIVVVGVFVLHDNVQLFSNSYRVDPYAQFFKLLIAVGLVANLILGWPLRSIPKQHVPEYYVFFFSAGLGMMLLSSVFNFLVLYLSMELTSYSLYTLVAMRRDRTESIESAVKYFLVGATSSAIGLYGLSFVYGSLGGLGFGELVAVIQSEEPAALMLVTGLLMVFSSFFFKLAAFPFHTWAPDAYEAADTPVSMFLATVGKLAGIAALFRIVYISHAYLPKMGFALGIIAILTMSYGNFVAFRQSSAKRLFAYSSIAQAGYLLLGMIGFRGTAPMAVVFYSVVYLLMNLVVFLVVMAMEQKHPDAQISDFRGLHQRSPLLAVTLMIALFSLAGVPPMSGFFGKWLLFTSAVEAGYTLFVSLAILNSVISLFYYLFLVKAAYYSAPDEKFAPLSVGRTPKIAAFTLALVIVLLGVFPLPVMRLFERLDITMTMLP